MVAPYEVSSGAASSGQALRSPTALCQCVWQALRAAFVASSVNLGAISATFMAMRQRAPQAEIKAP